MYRSNLSLYKRNVTLLQTLVRWGAVLLSLLRDPSKARAVLEHTGECTLAVTQDLQTFTGGHQPHGQLAALSMRPFQECLGAKKLFFVCFQFDKQLCYLLGCDFLTLYLLLCVVHLSESPFSYNKTVSSQNPRDSASSTWHALFSLFLMPAP